MGAKFTITDGVGDELLRRFGRRMRLVSEKDFKYMVSVGVKYWEAGSLLPPRVIDSEKIRIWGGKKRKAKK